MESQSLTHPFTKSALIKFLQSSCPSCFHASILFLCMHEQIGVVFRVGLIMQCSEVKCYDSMEILRTECLIPVPDILFFFLQAISLILFFKLINTYLDCECSRIKYHKRKNMLEMGNIFRQSNKNISYFNR